MGVFSGVGKFFGNLFGDDEDEKKKKKQQQQQIKPTVFKPAINTSGQLQVQNNRNADPLRVLPAPNTDLKLQKIAPPSEAQKTKAELDRLTQRNLAAAKKDAEKNEGWLGRNVLNKSSINRRAEVAARSTATKQFQDKEGWDNDLNVVDFTRKTSEKAAENVRQSAEAGKRLDRVDRATKKAGQIAQYVPITGSVINAGLAGTERLAKSKGKTAYGKDIANTRDKLDFDMTTEEKENLSPEQQAKLQNIRNISLGAAPLDFLGFAGLAKSTGTKAALKLAKESVTKGAVKQATKDAAKKAAVQSAKSMAAPAVVGTGISLGGQQYLTGEMDPLEAAKSGAIVAGVSQFFPGREVLKKSAKGSKTAPKPKTPGADPVMKSIRKSNQDAIAKFDAAMTENNRLVDDGDNAMPIVKTKQPKVAPTAQLTPVKQADNTPLQKSAGPSALTKIEDDFGTPEGVSIRATNSARARAPIVDSSREMAAGVESANPSQAQDAAKQIEAETVPLGETPEIQQARADAGDLDTPAFQRQDAKNAVANADAAAQQAQVTAAGAGDTALDAPTFLFKQELDDVIRQGETELNDYVNSKEGITQAELEAAQASIKSQTLERIAALQARRESSEIVAETPPAPQPVAASVTPQPVAPIANEIDTEVPMAAAPAPTPVIAPESQAITPPVVPDLPTGEQVPVAPRTHDALVSQLGPSVDRGKGDYGLRDKVNLDDLKTNAENAIANMDDDSLLRSFQTVGPETMVTDANSLAVARAALGRLSKSDDPAAAQTVTNILDGMERATSKSGQIMRIVQEEFDALPLPMKVRYITKKIDAANAEDPNYVPLRDRPEDAAAIEDQISLHLKKSERINERVAVLEGQLADIADAAKRGEATTENIQGLVKAVQNDRRLLAESNGELAKYFDTLTPTRKRGQKVNDFAKRMMLASFAGRINDVLTTTANVANLGIQNTVQAGIAKAVNLVKPGTISDTSKGVRAFARGTAEGLRKSAGEFRGKRYSGDLQKAIQSGDTETRSNMRRSQGPVGRTIQAATELATQASAGVGNQRLYQLAEQEGRKAGLKGDMLKQYTEARAAVPNRVMKDRAEQLHLEMNNLNKNPVSDTLNKIGSAIEGKSALGGLIKNQVMPFTSWLGGNIYNTITDKNVIANSVKIADAARKGDAEAVVRNISKLANNAAQTYALGYLLTQQGIITNEDAEGYNDAGAYFHIGDRYIPAGFLGFAAPNVVLGNAVFNGMNDPEAGSPAEQVGSAIESALGNMARSINVSGAIGAETNLGRSVNTAMREGGSFGEGALEFLGGAAGQFIPGVTGDVNSVLNNYTSMNPTKEAALTKSTNEDGTKDAKQTAINRLKNRIPVLSQSLPRKEGVAAPDPIDRITRGNRDTPGGKQAKADEKASAKKEEDITKTFKDKGYKLTKDNLAAPLEDSDYDTYIKGAEYYMAKEKSEGTLTRSDRTKYETDINRAKALKKGNYAYEDYETYKKIGVEEWRKLGDPDEDIYDMELFNQLWEIDKAMTAAGASAKEGRATTQKYTAKKTKGSGSGGGSRGGDSDALKLIKSNTIGNRPSLAKISFGELQGQRANTAPIPTVKKLKAADLLKKRKISVSKA